jgi:paraquat-inducible protein B
MEVSKPKISKRSGPSVVWLIPLITALVGGWLIARTLSEKGPEVTISFRTAEGIEVGKTTIKYKNVNIGMIEGIQFSDDLKKVILNAEFKKGTENFLRRNTRFWVVRPELSIRGASGLSTLISGAYIEIEPGQGSPQRHFVGQEEKPVVTADEAGKKVTLMADKLGSVDTGSPVYYQGLLAGEILGHELANDRRSVYIYAFIKDPFDQLVRGNTRFWNVSGMEISMDADGFKVKTESIASMIFGGVAFETPESLERGSEDIDNLIFTLYENHDSILEHAFTKKVNFVLFFDGSVRGLSIGAPVEFKGIKIGSVLDIRLEYDNKNTSFSIPVLIAVEPERIIEHDTQQVDRTDETLQDMVKNGLRARLQTGSLITGQLFVELDMFPEAPVVMRGDGTSRYPELPTIEAANFAAITKSVQDLVAKLDGIKFDKIGDELLGTLQGTNRIVNSPEVEGTVADLEQAMESLRSILKKVDSSNIKEAIDAGHVALDKLGTTLTLTNRILKPNSPLQYNIIQLAGELEETARAIRALVETLERNPQSLIFGKEAGEE